MQIIQHKMFFAALIFASSLVSAEEQGCPYPEKYIEIDRAYHQCVNGQVRKGASCELFVKKILELFPRYNCKRRFDTSPVPAIWLFDAASEDYIQLIYELATKSKPVFDGKWFEQESSQAKKSFLVQSLNRYLMGI